MNIGSATLSSTMPTAIRQAASENNPAERENDGDSDDKLLKVEPVPAKPVPAAVGKGMGLLVDVSF